MRSNSLRRISLLLVALSCAACTPRPDAPEDFIAAMRHAYERKDAETVTALTADIKTLHGVKIPAEFREELEQYSRDKEREDLESEFERGGMWARAWSSTRYVSSREHGDHIHVTVDVDRARSEVVLVRQDGSLKLHPRPRFLGCSEM
ncbi:MAG: hypothetical protein ACYC7A_02175 [Thermoanaerobaculia bacterium]